LWSTETAFERAVALAPNNSGYHGNLAGLLGESRDLAQAIEHCDRAIALDPTDAMHRSNRGLTHDRAGNYEQAVADFSAAIERNTKRARSYFDNVIFKAQDVF